MVTLRHAKRVNHGLYIYIAISLLLPSAADELDDFRGHGSDDSRLRMTREYHLRQGALRGAIVKPSKYDLQEVEVFLGIPYAAPPVGNFRFMPPVSAPPWSGVKSAIHFAPVCPQSLPLMRKGNPPSLGRQGYMNRLKTFLHREAEDCLYLNIYVPYRELKSKRFPVLVLIHGDSFEWSSGNPYDGKILAAYGNIMVITINYRLGILGFMKPSLTEHVYGNNGLLDQLAALQWIKDNIQDLNGDPDSVTIMGHGAGAACVSFLMLSPISNGLFHRAILMSGSALADWAMTKDPTQYTLQVAQNLGCNPMARDLMTCLQSKPLSEIKKVQILARDWETPLGPTVAGSFIPSEPAVTMESFPNLLSKYQLLSGVSELEQYHEFGAIELKHGILDNQRDDFINKYTKLVYEGAEKQALKEILKQYGPAKLDPQRWSVELNRNVILDVFSDARGLSPMVKFANYHSEANSQSYFCVFGHNSVSTEYASLNKSVYGEEMPYILGIPLGGANSHFHTEYTLKEKLLSEVVMRLWTNFVKIGTPNTQRKNEYLTLDKKYWGPFNIEWPEYNVEHQSYLKLAQILDLAAKYITSYMSLKVAPQSKSELRSHLELDAPPHISSLYRSNFTSFWNEYLPSEMEKYIVDPLFGYTPAPTQRPKPIHRNTDPIKKLWNIQNSLPHKSSSSTASFGRLRPFAPSSRKDTDMIYKEIQSIKVPVRPVPNTFRKPNTISETNTVKTKIETYNAPLPPSMPIKTSSATITLIVTLLVIFVIINIAVCTILYVKKRRLNRKRSLSNRNAKAENGEVDVIGRKSSKDDSNALKTLKNGYTVIKSINLTKKPKGNKKELKQTEPCKTPKSDDSGGFRERFQLRRHLSTSTLDAHTKVKDWITNEMMHRCSPAILRDSNSAIEQEKGSALKPFTRSEELLTNSKRPKHDNIKVNESLKSKANTESTTKTITSEKTTSTPALGSNTSIESNKNTNSKVKLKNNNKSNESIKSKGVESIKSTKVSIAIDATPSARTNSILNQEPIEYTKSFTDEKLSSGNNKPTITENSKDTKMFTNQVVVNIENKAALKISHKHSTSDPVTDSNYDRMKKNKFDCDILPDIPPPITFRNDINVTSKDENIQVKPLTTEETLKGIRRRNCPKVLPDLPKSQKRLSLQPTNLQTFSTSNSFDSTFERLKVPPLPPPRTSTLDRRMAFKNTKPLSSFNTSNFKKINENDSAQNYENIDNLSPSLTSASTSRSFDSSILTDNSTTSSVKLRDFPKIIIPPTSADRDENKSCKGISVEIPIVIPRVTLPDDFHTLLTDSRTSSFYSDEELEEVDDDFSEDKLIQELVGGVESPYEIENMLDTKGPETMFERKLEIVPVKINNNTTLPINENYVCISDLQFHNISDLEQTAQIKSNLRANKLQNRSDNINKPREKAIKISQKKTKKTSILHKKSKKSSKKSSFKSKGELEHSNSGSSNNTETSAETVKRVEVKRDSNYN